MKTFLEICGDAWGETGLSGNGPVSIATATGIEKKMAGWVRQAFIDIQQYRKDWPWMFKEFSFTTSPNRSRYPTTLLNLTDVEKWDFSGASIYKTVNGKIGEMFLGSTTYQRWWNSLRIGERQPTQPALLFFDPVDNTLAVFPEPDGEYTITLRYYKAPQRLKVDIDIPLMPTNQSWEEIIKWRALWYYGFHEGAPDLFTESEVLYEEMIHALDNLYGSNISISVRPIA